jgi:PIN domain nuclease of toxin-antitoxin system
MTTPIKLPIYIGDTHALVWYLTNDSKLSFGALEAFEKVINGNAVLIIPAVVLAELFMIVQKQRTPLVQSTLQKVIKKWRAARHIHLTNLTPDIVIRSTHFQEVPDIFDRLIVAEADRLAATIITRDLSITAVQQIKTIW